MTNPLNHANRTLDRRAQRPLAPSARRPQTALSTMADVVPLPLASSRSRSSREQRNEIQRTPDRLERTVDGFRVRLRYGKGLRGRFLIRLQDEVAAERRATRMRELADLLVRSGQAARAPIILEEAGAAATERDFVDALKIAEGLCGTADQTPPDKRRSFSELAKLWTNGSLAREFPDQVSAKRTAARHCAPRGDRQHLHRSWTYVRELAT